jgi:uncharacterized protein YbgA (DUF1722 family)
LLEESIDPDAVAEIEAVLAEYLAGRASLLAAIDRLAAEVSKLEVAGLQAQSYLNPDPRERALRYGET